MKPAAFFFDLDGTLADTETPWTRAIVAFLADRGVSAAEDDVARIVCGRSWFDIHADIHRLYPSLPAANALKDAEALRPYYGRVVTDPESVVIASSVAFLKRVATFAPVAIVSGSPRDDVWRLARTCGVAAHLRFVLGAEDYARGKPAPDCYLKAASMLEADASQCVAVEDSTAGVRAGRAAGMQVLALDRGGPVPQDFTGATWLVRDLSEIDVREEFEPNVIGYQVTSIKDQVVDIGKDGVALVKDQVVNIKDQVAKVKDATSSRLQDLTKWTTSKK